MSDTKEAKKGELTFFGQIGKELTLTPEQEASVAALRKEGMGQEMRGLPIVYPRIEILHQGTAMFKFKETDETVKTFKGVFIHVEPSKVWWPTKYGAAKQEGDDGFPACFSRDLIEPDKDAKDPQAPRCAGCPQNEWGSDVKSDGSQGRGRACKEVRRIFLMAEGHLSPHWMAVPPSSLKALSSYFITIRDKGFQKPQEVVTTFSLKTVENKDGVEYSELSLALGEVLPITVLAMIADWKKKIMEMLTTAAPIQRDEYEGAPAKT